MTQGIPVTQAVSESVEQTIAIGRKVATLLLPNDMLVLCGDLGAGKTHFSKGVAAGLGVDDEITSPTFNILREYDGKPGYDNPAGDFAGAAADVAVVAAGDFAGTQPAPVLAHWDLYRLEEPEQLEDVDFFGITESGAISLVEWGDKFLDELPEDYLEVSISIGEDDARVIEFTGRGSRGEQLEQQVGELLA